jgi:hypothetical protein
VSIGAERTRAALAHASEGGDISPYDARMSVEAGERRLLGLDLPTIGPALLVLALAGVMSLVLPSIDSRTSYSNAVRRGDVVRLAAGITLVPAAGWDVASGSIVGSTRSQIGSTAGTELVKGSLRFDVQAAPFQGTPASLLTRINAIAANLHHARGRASGMTARYAVTTRQGVVGVAENFVGMAREGSVYAFIFAPPAQSAPTQAGRRIREGVEIVVSGAPDEMSRNRHDIVAMIRSIEAAS